MKTRRCILVVCTVLLFLNVNIAFAENEQAEADYQRALTLKESGEYDEASKILNRLSGEYTDSKYKLAVVDTMLEQVRVRKEAGDPGWKTKAKEAQSKIKAFYSANSTNPDYWILYIKFSGLVEKERHFTGGIKKALYFKPGYTAAYIVMGDINFHLAKMRGPYATFIDDEDDDVTVSEAALTAYESALKSNGITDERKAYVYYRMGELESSIFDDKKAAVKFWEKSLSISSDSKWGELSTERLTTHR